MYRCSICEEGYDGRFCREYGITEGEAITHVCDESRALAEENARRAKDADAWTS